MREAASRQVPKERLHVVVHAVDAVRQLRALGITPVMLTGDNARTGAAIAALLGVECRADLMPDD
ncbi:lead, cadmium, zinc and mercury-transporting ATPase [mine drainage metagenome]|uniref:Lead, cadmium, zinc and mercury-transporting ATPase n=1 Tax=mine drainage metagenome TaxID=410659 RepID=A0A1J5NZJ4_9ZZZZ